MTAKSTEWCPSQKFTSEKGLDQWDAYIMGITGKARISLQQSNALENPENHQWSFKLHEPLKILKKGDGGEEVGKGRGSGGKRGKGRKRREEEEEEKILPLTHKPGELNLIGRKSCLFIWPVLNENRETGFAVSNLQVLELFLLGLCWKENQTVAGPFRWRRLPSTPAWGKIVLSNKLPWGLNPLTGEIDGLSSKLFLCDPITVWLRVSHFPEHFSLPSAKCSNSPRTEHGEGRTRESLERVDKTSDSAWLLEARHQFFYLGEKYLHLYQVTNFAPAPPNSNFLPGLSSIKGLACVWRVAEFRNVFLPNSLPGSVMNICLNKIKH